MVDERTVASENFKRREVVGVREMTDTAVVRPACALSAQGIGGSPRREVALTVAYTDAARQWEGWGTALKPALEPITVARKPFKVTVADNVRAHGTGALNIDGCRIEGGSKCDGITTSGRWPANLIHDGSAEVDGSLGSASRFFYCAKTSRKDRGEGNNHPTVKPTDLMAYLCRLVTPPGGVVLDPFMGSGSTGKAAVREGFRFIGIEMDAEYLAIAEARIAHEAGK